MENFLQRVLAGEPNVTFTFNDDYDEGNIYPPFWSEQELAMWCTANNCNYTHNPTTGIYTLNKNH